MCWPCCIWGHWFSQMLIAVCDLHTNGSLPTRQIKREVLLVLEYNHLSHERNRNNESSYTLFTFTFTILCAFIVWPWQEKDNLAHLGSTLHPDILGSSDQWTIPLEKATFSRNTRMPPCWSAWPEALLVLLVLEYNHLSHERKGNNESSYTLFTFTFTILCDVHCVTVARKR